MVMLVVRQLLGEETNTCVIMLSTKKGSNCLHINAFGMAQPEFEPTTSRSFSGCSNPQPPGQVLNLEGF